MAKKDKIAVWDGLPVREYIYEIYFHDGYSAGQTKTFTFKGHCGNCFEKLSWLVANPNMSIPKYDIVKETVSEPLLESQVFGGAQ